MSTENFSFEECDEELIQLESEHVLSRDRDSPEEDEAWKNL